jgi:hypothetical protein
MPVAAIYSGKAGAASSNALRRRLRHFSFVDCIEAPVNNFIFPN